MRVYATLYERAIREALQGLDATLHIQPTLEGISPDFLLQAHNGRSLIIEAKAWEPTKRNMKRAVQEASALQASTGVDRSFVVLPGDGPSRPDLGVVFQGALPNVLSAVLEADEAPRSRGRLSLVRTPLIFAAMPFAAQYEDVFYLAMVPAAKSAKAACKRVDQEDFQGDIVEKIQSFIRQSVAVIADLSEGRPNVLYEVGFAHALRKPTVHVCSTPMAGLPFDVRNWNTIEYQQGQTHRLKNALGKRLRAIL